MKKYLFPALALGLVMTSCQSDEPFAPVEGGEKQVTFTLNVPGELGTRADFGANKSGVSGVSNEGTANIQYTLVLEANGDKKILDNDDATINGKTATFSPTVVLGREYKITAYASLDGAWDGINAIDITKHFNDETKDAYFYTTTHNFAEGDLETLSLKRPFGKLRLLATDYKLDATGVLNTAVKNVKITYNDAQAAEFDVFNSQFEYGGNFVNTEAEDFGYYAAEEDGAMPIFADYIPANPGDNMVDFTVEVTYTNDETYSRTFNDIPVKRNALTTLRGNFFTAGAEITVTVDDNFDNFIPGEGNTEEQLRMTAIMGGEYTLQSDVTLSKPLEIGADMVLNLNGKTITGTMHKSVGAVIKVAEGASLKLIGGTISSTADNGGSAIQNSGTLDIENVTLNGAPNADGNWPSYTVNNIGTMTAKNAKITSYHGAVASYGDGAVVTLNDSEIDMAGIPGFTSHGIYTYNNGKVFVNGGTYANKATDQASSGASVINGAVEVNAGTFTGRIENYYGTPVIKGGNFTVDPTRFVAAGCKVEVKDGKYYVLTTSVSTANQLYETLSVMATIGSTEEIKLTDDINLSGIEWNQIGTSEKPFAGKLDGNGKKISNLTIDNTEYAALIAYTAENTQIKNLTLENVNIQSNKHAAGVVCVAGDGLTIENVKVSGEITAASYAGGIVHNASNVIIKNCENNANVNANRAGGIASWVIVGANIENVINTGNITGEIGASGIAHGFAGSIKNAVNRGDIKSKYYEAAAGIAGVQKAASTYEYCYNYGNVISIYDDANASAAGILGQSAGSKSTLKYCANYGNITAEASYAAGIAYCLYGSITASYCYNEGAINGADGAGAIAPKAQYGTADKANYCLNAGTITSSNGIVYQGSNNNTSCYYYDGNVLKNVSGNTVATTEEAMTVLNGGTDTEFFSVENGKICVK